MVGFTNKEADYIIEGVRYYEKHRTYNDWNDDCLFYDETNNAKPEVLNALYDICHKKEVE